MATPASSPDATRRGENVLETLEPDTERHESPTSARPPSLNPASPRESLVDVSVWNQQEAVRAAANRELHTDLVKGAVERLGKVGAFTAAALAVVLGGLAVLALDEGAVKDLLPIALQTLGGGIALSLALYGLTHVERLRAQFVTDLGYLYLFLLCLLLGLLRHSQVSAPAELVRQVSPVVIPILAFGALIPAPPRKALAVSLGAAAMDPLAMVMMRAQHPTRELVLLMSSPLLAAFIAHQISRVVHRLSEGITKAREVGSYRLVERLGTGGMAEVWRANHQMLARPAAVKLIRPKVLLQHEPLDAERLLRLFTREARATASLSSPHTIHIYDFGVTREGAFYYVMELLDGLDLQSLVERFGPQSAERTAHLLIQACRSLGEAHERNFVHRDIKPANIFSCLVGGEYDFVKVLDFGLVFDRHPTPEQLDDEKGFVGTPAVMAPEMVRFQAPVDARADLYALGCVGYWLLTGKRVFDASTRHDMLVMHAHQKPVPPSRRVELPMHEGLEAVIMSCLEKNPNKRPQTARELGDRLAQLRFEHPWKAERAALWWKQHRSERRPSETTLDRGAPAT